MTDIAARLQAGLAGRYRLERQLGEGGMATVYLVEDLKHRRQLALKVLRPELTAGLGTERFLREIDVAAHLQHPHILPLFDSGELGEGSGIFYFVMPYVEGESLRARLDREKQLPIADALRIVAEVADALGAAHARGIIHRDIKPENILLVGDHAVVADFGIARAMSQAGGARLTQSGTTLGTPQYMSPEQASSDEVDGRADIYSLGCVGYEMLTGAPPFAGATAQAVMARHMVEAVPGIRTVRGTVPAGVEQALLRALAKSPADRYATALQFAEALERGATGAAGGRTERGRKWWAGALVAAVVLGVGAGWWGFQRRGGDASLIRSLVVLPLDNLTGDPEQQYFVDGMHEALTAELSKIGALKVISRTSAMQYRGSRKPAPEIARELGVAGLIEGSVAREGDRVRITVQLIHAPSDRHLWASQFDRDLGGILALHSELARAIADEVRATLTPQEEVRLSAARPVNPAAFELYLLGRHQWSQRTIQRNSQAIASFQRALTYDPGYAPAYAAMADAHLWLGEQGGIPQQEGCTLAAAAIGRAMELDASLADAHVARANWQLHCDWNWVEAERSFQRAISLDPGSAAVHQLYGRSLGLAGRYDEAMEVLQRARELDPLSSLVSAFIGQIHIYARRYDLAVAQFHKALEVHPDHALLHHNLGEVYLAQGRWDEAVQSLERSIRGPGNPSSHFLAMLGSAYARAGRSVDAVGVLRELQRRSKGDLVSAFDMASLHVALGEEEQALAWLERGYAQKDYWFMEMNAWPWLDAIRTDPRYLALMRRVTMPG